MADGPDPQDQARSEYVQLLRLHEQLLEEFARARDGLLAPSTHHLLKEIRSRTGSAPDLTELTTKVEETIRSLKISQSHLQRSIVDRTHVNGEVPGLADLPAYLARFLAERTAQPGFSYAVTEDPLRGWMIKWKEYAPSGTVRGYGQICERPYAWLED
jgi:hypothetical protein